MTGPSGWPRQPLRETLESTRRVRAAYDRSIAILFGDDVGLTLYLAFLLFFVSTWRVGVFINDIDLFVSALDHLATGSLSLGSPTGVSRLYPGMHLADGRVYARNYGQIALSVPVLWVVELVGPVRFHAIVVVGWSLLALAVAVRVADRYDRRRTGIAAGTVVAVGVLVANAATYRPVVAGQASVVALQVTTMLVAGFTGVFLYRLIARQAGEKLGVLAGATAVFATPVGFWATVPKRHAFTATLVVVALYGLARSREEFGPSARVAQGGFRGLAYASAGLLAWIHAPEGFTLLLAVAVVDLPTAPRTDSHTLAVVATALALSLVPFLLTNFFVSGNPLEPPRFLPTFEGIEPAPGDATSASGGQTGGPDPQGSGGSGTTLLESLVPSTFVRLLQRGLSRYVHGGRQILASPGRLGTIFLRWGRHGYEPAGTFFGNGTNLAVLEVAPVLAAFVVAPVRMAVVTARRRTVPALRSIAPQDAFVVVAAVLYVTLYFVELPVRVQITVRYLHPLYPLLVYALFRQQWLRDVLEEHTVFVLWGYEAAVLLGVPLTVGGLLLTRIGKGGFFQAFGLVALVVAGAFLACSLAGALSGSGRFRKGSALGFGLASGVGTAFVLLTALVVMHYGPSALPIVDVVTGEIRFWIVRLG